MPGRRSVHSRGRRSLRGRGLWSWLKKAAVNVHRFVKKHKVLSRAGRFIGSTGIVPPQYAGGLAAATTVADKLGYGRRARANRLAGRGLHSLAGGSLRLAGARRY